MRKLVQSNEDGGELEEAAVDHPALPGVTKHFDRPIRIQYDQRVTGQTEKINDITAAAFNGKIRFLHQRFSQLNSQQLSMNLASFSSLADNPPTSCVLSVTSTRL